MGGIGGTPSRLSREIESAAARALRSPLELARGVSVGVTGFGPYDVGIGWTVFARAASSSRPVMLRFWCSVTPSPTPSPPVSVLLSRAAPVAASWPKNP